MVRAAREARFALAREERMRRTASTGQADASLSSDFSEDEEEAMVPRYRFEQRVRRGAFGSSMGGSGESMEAEIRGGLQR